MLSCVLAFAGNAQAMMGTGGSTGTTTGGTGMMNGGTGTTTGTIGMTTGSTGTMGTYMQMPTARQMFEYGPTTSPVMGTDISTAMPMGVGPVAMGGNMITIHAAIGQFSNPMDVYLTLYAPADNPFNIYMMRPDGTIKPASEGIEPWMTGVTSIDQTPVNNLPTAGLPKGTYTVGLMATPSGGNMSTYYMWTTHFVIQ
jgi:hypothetical protein